MSTLGFPLLEVARSFSNTPSSPRYRREVIPFFIKKAFDRALEKIRQGI
jgi:hypothetical protein